MNIIDRENAVLASFLYADDLGMDKSQTFELDQKVFTSSYRRATANKINDETNGDKLYGYLSITLEGHTEGTAYEQDWIDILAQTPMPFPVIKRVHDDLVLEYKQRTTKAFR